MSTEKKSKIGAITLSEPSRRPRHIGDDSASSMLLDPIEMPISVDQTPRPIRIRLRQYSTHSTSKTRRSRR